MDVLNVDSNKVYVEDNINNVKNGIDFKIDKGNSTVKEDDLLVDYYSGNYSNVLDDFLKDDKADYDNNDNSNVNILANFNLDKVFVNYIYDVVEERNNDKAGINNI